jgi:C1A family cysteine protease
MNVFMTDKPLRKYGWRPDLPDHRDKILEFPPERGAAVLPPSVDLRPQCPPVYDQGQLGSCTANAIAAAVEFERKKQKLPDFMPSRLFLYYNERVMEGTPDSDSGAMLRDGMRTLYKQGICTEALWPYDESQVLAKPSERCYQQASSYRSVYYAHVPQTLDYMKRCLAAGFPFVFGFTVYDSFESQQVASTGVMPMPSPDESVLGGHAVLAVGYDDASQRFLVRNSWGASWGIGGYFTMPYAYLANRGLSTDLWTLRVME